METRARTEDLRFVWKCPAGCKLEGWTNIGEQEDMYHGRYTPKCSCGQTMLSTGEIVVVGIKDDIFRTMSGIVYNSVKNYKTDFIRDEQVLAHHGGRFLWSVRENGTQLLLFDLPYERKEEESEYFFYWAKNAECEYYYYDGFWLNPVNKEDCVELWAGEVQGWKR